MQLGMLFMCAHARSGPAKRDHLKLSATAVHTTIVIRPSRVAGEIAAATKFRLPPNLNDRESYYLSKEIKKSGGVYMI